MADEKQDKTPVKKAEAPPKRVRLATTRDEVFDLRPVGLEPVTEHGTSYSMEDADEVRALAHKYGVRLFTLDEEK